MQLSIVLLRLVSMTFFIIALVRIWLYLVKNNLALGNQKCRGASMLAVHSIVLMTFFCTQVFTLFQMYQCYTNKHNNYLLTASLLLWTCIDTLNSLVMLLAYNELNMHCVSCIQQ